MRNKYQRKERKSNHKFEVVGGQELLVRVLLPIAEVWAERWMRNAYAMNNYAEAKEALQKIFRQLERINPSAARSLEEGLDETLTVHRLGLGAVLRRSLAPTNPIESCLSTVQRVARNVKALPRRKSARCTGQPPDCWKHRRSSDASKAIKKSCC
jgi:hypothetical protein